MGRSPGEGSGHHSRILGLENSAGQNPWDWAESDMTEGMFDVRYFNPIKKDLAKNYA